MSNPHCDTAHNSRPGSEFVLDGILGVPGSNGGEIGENLVEILFTEFPFLEFGIF